MANALIDNSEQFKLVKYIKELVSRPDCNHIMIATGYWDLPGTALVYEELKDFFTRGGKLDLLIGQEPQLQYYQASREAHQFPDFYIQRDVDSLTDEYKPIGKLIIDNALTEENPNGKFEIRVFGQGEHKEFLHAKCYIFLGNTHTLATGIIGSSNFTLKGLQGNAELNYLEENGNSVAAPFTEYSTSKSHKAWFEELWQNSELWSGKFIKNILKPSHIGVEIEKDNEAEKTLSPYEVYIKYLQLQFGDMVDANTSEVLKSYLPPSFNTLEYQLDAVKQCFSVMKRFGGFILGDVVGLGKTVVGVLLIRHFLENAESLGRARKVLIVTPPAIKKAWEKTIKDFDNDNPRNNIELSVDFVTTGSIGKIADELENTDDIEDNDEIENLEVGNYGMVLIDESHNFRNSETQKYKAIDDLIGLINPTPYVALLSATPQNNSPKDLYNQIRLFQRTPNNSNLPNVEGGKLDSLFSEMERRFKEARAISQDTDEGKAEARAIVKEVSEKIRNCVLNDLVVRRTRTDIRNLYGEDAELLKFPTVKGPHKLEYRMDEELSKLFADTVDAICLPQKDDSNDIDDPNRIGFHRYAAISHFKDSKHKDLYKKRNLDVHIITKRLKRIMRILLVKRLESSIPAFKITLNNLLSYTDVMIDMLQNDCVYICPDIDINKLHSEAKNFSEFKTKVETLIAQKGENNRRFKASDFDINYLDKLKNDKKLIDRLLKRWDRNTEDPKFDRFKEAIKDELFNREINNPSGLNKPRLVIFTEAIDTQKVVARALRARKYRVLEVSAQNRTEMQEAIEANFDANCKPESRRDDYDVIVTTEVLAEGVNLHRSNVILNYDAPWNATRLMQRIGRVNRIGSTEDFVHVFNFFPSDEGNSQIRLIEKAYAKLQSFHEMFGEDNKVFSEREELVEHDLQHFVDGDESPFGPFIKELKAFQVHSPERYDYISSVDADGLGGVLQTNEENSHGIFVFTDNSQELISVEVEKTQEDTPSRIISSLATMQLLKCTPDAEYSNKKLDTILFDAAKRAYQKHVAHYITASDSSKKSKNALAVLDDLRSRSDVTQESKKLLKQIEKLVRAKDNYVIKQVMRFENYQGSLFGTDEDINALLEAALSNLANRAQAKRGEVKLVLYSETKNNN
ncbi:MAG: DEAD/DEAH box helicase family protein [Bacteroidales bacterium]|nr:DEAD/DEAH box helicase family protein [Bacteroidales bacterium]